MIGMYRIMKRMNPMSWGVVMPALSGSVLAMVRKLGKMEFKMRTNAIPKTVSEV